MTDIDSAYEGMVGTLAAAQGFSLPPGRVSAVAALLPGLERRLLQEAASLPQAAPLAVAFDPDPEGTAG